jgi:hypothetical protein
MEITYSPRRFAKLLAGVALALALISLAGNIVQFQWDYSNRFIRMFNLGVEATVPTWYPSILLLLSAVILGLIAHAKRQLHQPYVLHWAALGLIFLLFSIDEVAMFHERLGGFLSKHVETSGVLYYPWVVPGAIFTLSVAIAYLRFLWHLPADTRWLIIAAGLIFVTGALGVEMIAARHHDLYGYETFTYAMLETAEETLEMLGVVLFIFALLHYLQKEVSEVRFHSRDAPLWRGVRNDAKARVP